jgi:hypothetical protein
MSAIRDGKEEMGASISHITYAQANIEATLNKGIQRVPTSMDQSMQRLGEI